MGLRLMEVGHTLTVWNRSADKAKPLTDAGATLAASPAELAARSEAVITILTDGAAIDAVYNSPQGLLAGAVKGKLFIEMSTVRPGVQVALAEKVRAKGAAFVECPVGGTTGPARQGKLFGFMGAEPADAERAKPILDQLCRRVEHVGPVGSGTLAKFTINMPLMIYYQALGEALSMARPLGLPPERLMDIICDTSGAPTMMKARGPVVAKMLQGDNPPVTFDLDGCIKDLKSMLAEGGERGMSLPLVEKTIACMQESSAAGLGAKEAATHSVYWSTK
jgi:3-hydroxyisobutyrate dehydrogenase